MIKRFFNLLTALVLILTVLSAALFAWAHFVEPAMIRVDQVDILTAGLRPSADGLKIALFSDTHLGFGFDAEKLADAARLINEQGPDLICFTGDLYDDYSKSGEEDMAVIHALAGLEAPLGKYAVLGNHDYGPQAQKRTDEILTAGGFSVLYNESVRMPEYGLHLFGMDDCMFGAGDASAYRAQEESCNIVLCHEPDVFDGMQDVDLMLSGHTHGGQVRLPLVGAAALPGLGKNYVSGLYEKESGKIYVNRGLGTTIMQLRLFCTPEITILTLKNAK